MIALVMRRKGTILCSLHVFQDDEPTSLKRDLEKKRSLVIRSQDILYQ